MLVQITLKRKIKRTLLLFSLCCSSLPLLSQDYFQQFIDYQIEATLNDSSHTLTADMLINYHNHAPQPLDTLYFHLWANAYQSKQSAWSKQMLNLGQTDFYFSLPSDRGGYENIGFRHGDDDLSWGFINGSKEIAWVKLPGSLTSGQSAEIKISYVLKIPKAFSRLGHEGQTYQMAQWYPKPAVYGPGGWKRMPYLENGEFFADFGNYEVTLTLPQDYVVASTGDPVAESGLPAGETTTRKKWQFAAKNVHDFAWIADKNFVMVSDSAMVAGKIVRTNAFFSPASTESWNKAAYYAARAIEYFSEQVGHYPYASLTIAQGLLPEGEGMEYPMITFIGSTKDSVVLDEIIAHEVGHNWFQGMLASNEREYPWLDEGLATFYEQAYMQLYHPAYAKQYGQYAQSIFRQQQRTHRLKPLDPVDEKTTEDDYFIHAYIKPALGLTYIKAYLGDEVFSQAIKDYFSNWKWKHPGPDDLQASLEKISGKKLDWFFRDYIHHSEVLDFALLDLQHKETHYQLSVRNHSASTMPIPLSAFIGDSLVRTLWVEGTPGDFVVDFPNGNYDRLSVGYAGDFSLDAHPINNHMRPRGWFKKLEPLKIAPFSIKESETKTQLSFLPVVAYNVYDKWMIGLGNYNFHFPVSRFQYSLAPLYSFAEKKWSGVATFNWRNYLGDGPAYVDIGFSASSFAFQYNPSDDYQLRYRRLQSQLSMHLPAVDPGDWSHRIRLKWLNPHLDQAVYDDTGTYTGNIVIRQNIWSLDYKAGRQNPIQPFFYKIALEYQSYLDFFEQDQQYLRLAGEWNQSFLYASQKSFDLRFFAGGFIDNTRRNAGAFFPGAFSLSYQGFADYRFDHLFLGRSETKGIASQQIGLLEGGMKYSTGSAYALGRSNDFIFTCNMSVDLPQDFPPAFAIRPYLDFGYFHNAMPTGSSDTFRDQMVWSGGMQLRLFQGMASLFFPLAQSQNLGSIQKERGNYLQRITFYLNWEKLLGTN